MNLFQKYLDYLKDNPNHYWFRRKILGWGWTPATWEGWMVTIGFAILFIGNGIRFGNSEAAARGDVTLFFIQMIALIVLLVIIAWRTGEPPKWQWGFPKKEDTQR